MTAMQLLQQKQGQEKPFHLLCVQVHLQGTLQFVSNAVGAVTLNIDYGKWSLLHLIFLIVASFIVVYL